MKEAMTLAYMQTSDSQRVAGRGPREGIRGRASKSGLHGAGG